MRIGRNSAAWLLLQVSVVCGQLPYHALKLLDSNYARAQDAFQKLCRAGYLEVVKAPGHKSFFVTDAGFEAYCRLRQKDRRKSNAFIWDKPTGTHSIEKAVRRSRINEARLFFVLLCRRKYQTPLQIKREQERQAVRSTDSLKYSRFVGCIYDEERFLHLVYHFGNGNQRLNPNGEKNAAVRLVGAMMSFEKVILVETPEAIADILEYSLWALKKAPRSLRHMKMNSISHGRTTQSCCRWMGWHKPLCSTLTGRAGASPLHRWKSRRKKRQALHYPFFMGNGWNCWSISRRSLPRKRRCVLSRGIFSSRCCGSGVRCRQKRGAGCDCYKRNNKAVRNAPYRFVMYLLSFVATAEQIVQRYLIIVG